MNKKLLLCSTALAGTLISGVALAEFKVGGDVTHTINLGANKGVGTNTQSGERLGTEMNIKLSAKNDLNNGMYISYNAKVEFDDIDTTYPDVEYELQLGQGNFYIGAGSDAGNCICATPTLPAVSYQPGTSAMNISAYKPLNYDGFMGVSVTGSTVVTNEANNTPHLSANLKAMGGTFSYIYTPHNDQATSGDNDHTYVTGAGGGKSYSYLYSGSPVKNVNFIVGRNVATGILDTSANEYTNDKIGVSYNFGQFAAGVEYQAQKSGDKVTNDNVWNYAVTYKASDTMSIGAQYGVGEAEGTSDAGKPKEKIKMLTAGYNLGAASIAVSLVQAENIANTANQDADGIIIATRYAF